MPAPAPGSREGATVGEVWCRALTVGGGVLQPEVSPPQAGNLYSGYHQVRLVK